MYLTVEPSRTQQRGVENVRTVGRRHDDNPFVGLEAVHLDEDLVEGLFAFVVTAAEPRASAPPHRVDFIDEDDAGLILFGEVEQVAHARRADADVHFHEIGTRNGEERNARFSRNRLCKQRFARARRADQKNASGNPRAEVGKLLGGLQKFDDLLKLFLFLLRARHVRETHLEVVLHVRLGFAHVHHLAAARSLAQNQPKNDRHEHDAKHRDNGGPHAARIGIGVIDGDAVGQPLCNDRVVGRVKVPAEAIIVIFCAVGVAEKSFQLIAADVYFIDFPRIHLGNKLAYFNLSISRGNKFHK